MALFGHARGALHILLTVNREGKHKHTAPNPVLKTCSGSTQHCLFHVILKIYFIPGLLSNLAQLKLGWTERGARLTEQDEHRMPGAQGLAFATVSIFP